MFRHFRGADKSVFHEEEALEHAEKTPRYGFFRELEARGAVANTISHNRVGFKRKIGLERLVSQQECRQLRGFLSV